MVINDVCVGVDGVCVRSPLKPLRQQPSERKTDMGPSLLT
jgi:hypothetical protein